MAEFLNTAFQDVKDSAKAQREADKANMEAVRASWDDAHMSPAERIAKMYAERAGQAAAAKQRTEAANARCDAAKVK